MKVAKCKYFDNKIDSIADHNKRPWDLMSWTHTQKPDSSEAIIFKSKSCLTIEDYWNAFQETLNSAHKWDTYLTHLIQAIHPKFKWAWALFSVCELYETLTSCLGQLAPGLDYITWTHIKCFCIDELILKLFVWIINLCFAMGFWPDSFKTSKTVVIPKLGKVTYNIPKVFHPIVLFNTLGKLFEKAIANRLQWEAACFEILHPCQFRVTLESSISLLLWLDSDNVQFCLDPVNGTSDVWLASWGTSVLDCVARIWPSVLKSN